MPKSARLKAARLKAGISQSELARRCPGLTAGRVSEFESGKNTPWPKARREMAQALGVPESAIWPDGK